MFLRFFLAVWLSIVVCIAGIVVLSNVLGFVPPDLAQTMRRATALDMVASVAPGGRAAIDDMATAVERMDPLAAISIDELPACPSLPSAQRLVRYVEAPPGCLRLAASAELNFSAVGLSPLAIPFLGASLIGLLAALLLALQLKRPIDTVKAGLHGLARGDLTVRIGSRLLRGTGEFAELARDFDLMAARIEGLSAAQRQLFHDVSHELRSPLARLQATAGVLRQSPAKLAGMLPRIEAEVGKLDSLVEEILTLARLGDAGSGRLARLPTDLVDLLVPIVSDASFEGHERGVSCRYEGPGTIKALVDPELCHRAFENVIRNAVRHTRNGTEVTVRASVRPGVPPTVLLTVDDEGPSVPTGELEEIFRPFRGASDGTRPGGAGLGLAIARRAVELHGGTVRAALRQPRGLRVTAELPVEPS